MSHAPGQLGELAPTDQQVFFGMSRSLFAVVDADGVMLRMSPSWADVLGRPLSELVRRHFTELVHPEDLDRTLAWISAFRRGELDLGLIENRYLHADGSSVWLQWDVVRAEDGATAWCIAHNISATRRPAQQQLVVAELGRLALEGLDTEPLLRAVADGVGQGLELPHVAVAQLVAGSDRLQLRATTGLRHPDGELIDVPSGLATLAGRAAASGLPQVLVDTGEPSGHYPPYLRDFGLRSVMAVPIGAPGAEWGALSVGDDVVRHFDDGEVRFLEQVAHVVASALERHEVEHRLQHQATHDSLTGLPNRHLLRERIELALRDARRSGRAVGLLLCDLDGFKDVNDSLGHAAGDSVLQQLAERLLAAVGAGSTVARLGGDEFALCVVGPSTELEVLGVADAVVEVMRRPFLLPGLEVPLSTSIGVAVSPTHGRDASTLLRHADVAMYRAKTRRLGWTLYDASLDAASGDRLALTADLRAALERGDLTVHYQPVVDIATGTVCSLEALARWHHEERGWVPPSDFVQLAEQTGLITALTSEVVRQVAAQLTRWRGRGLEVECAVNLSMAAVPDAPAESDLVHQLLSAEGLTVEITESWLADAHGQALVHQLAAAGVLLALDDFGTGYSSLAVLQAYPVQRMKLDREFLMGLDSDGRGQDLLAAVAELGAALGMEVVAEGVETRATADRLLAAGIELGQGFLWSPALPAHELEAWAGWV